MGQRARLWEKLSPNEFGEPQSREGKLIDDLLMEHGDVWTHAQAITGAPKEKWATAVKMVKDGATVAAINAYLHPQKAKPAKKEVTPSSSGGSGITIHRSSAADSKSSVEDAHARGQKLLQQAVNEPLTDEELEEANGDWFDREPVITAQALDNRFDQLETVLDGIKAYAPLVKELPTHSPVASLAFRKRARNLALELAEIVELFQD